MNQHVQLTPHHIDEQLDSTGFHQVAKQPRRDLEPVRVDKQERGCYLSTIAAEFVEDDRQTLECVALAGFHVDPRREWFELRELRFKRRKIRRIALE